jgi:hypothetical protein
MEENSNTIIIRKRRSPFTLSVAEIIFAILVGIATWIGLHSYLQSALPFPCGNSIVNIPSDCGWTRAQAWNTLGRPLFLTYAAPLSLSLALAVVFLIRSIKRDVLHFSIMGNFALSWPLFSFLGMHLLYVFGLCLLPIGLILSSLATIKSRDENRNNLDWISFPLSLAWIVISVLFFRALWSAYGD